MLSHVLGAMKGVYNVGESFFIEHRDIFCNACGRDCEVLTPDFLASLKQDRTNWYPRLAVQAKAEVLVSSDKNMDVLKRHDPEMDFDAVYCFRPPLEAHRSYARVKPPDHLDFENYLCYWASFYSRAHYSFKVKGRKIWVDFSEFSRDPTGELARLCAKLELPYEESALEFWRVKQHAVGGNFNPYDALRDGKMDRITIRPRPAPEFTDEELKAYDEHATAGAMYRAMQRWSHE